MDSDSNPHDKFKQLGFSLASGTRCPNAPSRQNSDLTRDLSPTAWDVIGSDEIASRRYRRREPYQVWPRYQLQETVARPRLRWRLSIVAAARCPPHTTLRIQASEARLPQSTGSEHHSLFQRHERPLRSLPRRQHHCTRPTLPSGRER